MKKLSTYIRTLVSIAFFVVLFMAVRRGDLLARLKDADPVFFTLSFLLIPVMISMSCLKWKVLLNHQGHRLPFVYLMRVYMIGYFFTNLLPSTVGGDVVRSYYAGRRIENQTHAAVSVFIERFTGLLLLLVLGVAAPLLKPGLYRHIAIIIPAACAALLLGVVVWVWTIKKPLVVPDRVTMFLLRGWRNLNQRIGLGVLNGLVDRLERFYRKVHDAVDHFHEKLMISMRALGDNRRTFTQVIALTIVFYLLALVNVYFAFRTFRVPLSFIEMSAVVPSIMLTFLLPVSQGNLGLAEGAYVFYFQLLGVPIAASLVSALFLRFKLLCSGVVGSICYLTHRDFRVDRAALTQQNDA